MSFSLDEHGIILDAMFEHLDNLSMARNYVDMNITDWHMPSTGQITEEDGNDLLVLRGNGNVRYKTGW